MKSTARDRAVTQLGYAKMNLQKARWWGAKESGDESLQLARLLTTAAYEILAHGSHYLTPEARDAIQAGLLDYRYGVGRLAPRYGLHHPQPVKRS